MPQTLTSALTAPAPGEVDEDTATLLAKLSQQFPGVPYLTLGQTVLWDEPVKAVFCRLMERLQQSGRIQGEARIVAGVHDTDYFAKLSGLTITDSPFVVLRHNDGDTRGLWSAAGEISALFGAEVVPSRAELGDYGVGFHAAARAYPGGSEAMLNQETDAPLWRAIVHTEPRPLIAAEVKLKDIGAALHQQLHWAFRQSLRAMGCLDALDSDEPCASRGVARQILAWIDEFRVVEPQGTLSGLYSYLIPRFWSLVRGGDCCAVETTTSMELFGFNTTTAALPRFRFLDLFLNPATRTAARESYDAAVRGSGIYTLDEFGEGALPFDVVIPGVGRGTLRLADGNLAIETDEPIQLCENCDPESVLQLAAILEKRLGPDIALVGKAVALIPMMAAEYLLVFHEKASSYTHRTQNMMNQLRAVGIDLQLHPMVRLQYSAWDALSGVEATLHLPPHLAGPMAFGREELTASDFAATWREVLSNQDQLLARLQALRSPADLMEFLAQTAAPHWQTRARAHRKAHQVLLELRTQGGVLENEILALRAQASSTTASALRAEQDKGSHFRAHVLPLKQRISDLLQAADLRGDPRDENGNPRKLSAGERSEQKAQLALEQAEIGGLREQLAQFAAGRAAVDATIEVDRQVARDLKARAQLLVKEKLGLEKGAPSTRARAQQRTLEAQAELQRLIFTRDALRVRGVLQTGNYRPTGWWLPMVSPDGRWFEQLASGARGRLEAL